MEKMKNVDLEKPVKFVCNHLIGEDHKPIHRRIVGFVVAICGVTLAMTSHEYCPVKALAALGDFLGYTMHAAGIIPLLKRYNIG
jgi:hypothetical protein